MLSTKPTCPMCKKPLRGVERQCANCKTDVSLLVDYVLTITTSVASGADQIFSFLPAHWAAHKLTIEFDRAGEKKVVDSFIVRV